MTNIKIILIILSVVACNQSLHISEKKVTDYKRTLVFSTKAGLDKAMGLPIPTEFPYDIYFCYDDKDTLSSDFKELILLCSNDTVFFEYKSNNLECYGNLLIPDHYEIRYSEVFDVNTFITSKLTPVKVYNPIRIGRWYYKDSTGVKEVKYNVELGSLGNYCD